jgi:hypothetical protein
MTRLTLLVLGLTGVAFGQMRAPILGYVQEGQRIRVMHGIPAAGAVGDFLDVGRELTQITVSPRQDYILAREARTGSVLRIVSGAQPVPIAGAMENPVIVMSPSGSAAALFLIDSGRTQVVTGLPNNPSIRDVAFEPSTWVTISDDGELAANKPYLAVAFLHGSKTLVAVSEDSLYTIENGVAIFRTKLANPKSLVDLGVTFDNRRVVLAEADGVIESVDLSTNTSALFKCECSMWSMASLGGSVFRLTNSGMGGVKLFDAEIGQILDVPRELSAAIVHHPVLGRRVVTPLANPPLPTVTIGGLPASTGPAQQPTMTITLGSAYPTDITGVATLTFASSVGGDDQTVQFGPGGRTINFTIPAGTTQAAFNGKAAVLTGTVAGNITVKLALSASGSDVTPTPAPSTTMAVTANVPFIQLVQLQQSGGGFNIQVTGFSTTRDMVSGTFHFAPSSNATLAAADVVVQLGPAFTTWYTNPASNAIGSQFLLTVPFTTQNGPSADIIAVTVTLTNSKGASNGVVNQ